MITTKKKTEPAVDTSRQVQVTYREGEDPQLASVRMIVGPHVTNANVTAYFATGGGRGNGVEQCGAATRATMAVRTGRYRQ